MAQNGVPIVVLGTNCVAMAADQLVARKDANIRKPEDLYGIKIGLLQGSTASAFLYYLAKHYNLDEKRLQVVNLPPPEQLAGAQLERRAGDAVLAALGLQRGEDRRRELVHSGLVSGFAANKGQAVQVSDTRCAVRGEPGVRAQESDRDAAADGGAGARAALRRRPANRAR